MMGTGLPEDAGPADGPVRKEALEQPEGRRFKPERSSADEDLLEREAGRNEATISAFEPHEDLLAALQDQDAVAHILDQVEGGATRGSQRNALLSAGDDSVLQEAIPTRVEARGAAVEKISSAESGARDEREREIC